MAIHTGRSSGKDNKTPSTSKPAKGNAVAAQMPAVPALQETQAPSIQKETNGEEPPQSPFIPVQTKERTPLQLKNKNDAATTAYIPIQRKENKTGLPDNLKSGVESLSGTNLSDVKVHYGSSQPAQFNAYAYAQGTDIHIAPGQEQHLPHEAWHVAQQKQGRVQATTQMKGAGINDDVSLEKEADDMGAKAMSSGSDSLASGYEHFNGSDIGDVKARSSLVSTTQRQTFENINNEVSASITDINHSSNSTVQKHAVTQLAAGKFLVDDGEELKAGQMHKSNFLSAVRAEVKKVAKEILEPVGLAQDNCPDLNYWINYYEGKDAIYFESVITRYAPATAGANTTDEYLGKLTEKVKNALIKHVSTGANEFDPEVAPKEVEEKRPDQSILNIQRKEMPIQLGAAASIPSSRAVLSPAPVVTPMSGTLSSGLPASGATGGAMGRTVMGLSGSEGSAIDEWRGDRKRAPLEGPSGVAMGRTEMGFSGSGGSATGEWKDDRRRSPLEGLSGEFGNADRLFDLGLAQIEEVKDSKEPIIDDSSRIETPEQLYRTIQRIRTYFEPARCEALTQLFLEVGLSGLIDAKPCTSVENINHNYAEIASCGGTQTLVMCRLLGTAAGSKKTFLFDSLGQAPPEKLAEAKATGRTAGVLRPQSISPGSVDQIFRAMGGAPCLIPFSMVGSKSHCFTIAGGGDHFFLYQGWINQHTLLDDDYTRELNAAELREFLRDIIDRKRGGEEKKDTLLDKKQDFYSLMLRQDSEREIANAMRAAGMDPGIAPRRGPGRFFVQNVDSVSFKYEVIKLTPPSKGGPGLR